MQSPDRVMGIQAETEEQWPGYVPYTKHKAATKKSKGTSVPVTRREVLRQVAEVVDLFIQVNMIVLASS